MKKGTKVRINLERITERERKYYNTYDNEIGKVIEEHSSYNIVNFNRKNNEIFYDSELIKVSFINKRFLITTLILTILFSSILISCYEYYKINQLLDINNTLYYEQISIKEKADLDEMQYHNEMIRYENYLKYDERDINRDNVIDDIDLSIIQTYIDCVVGLCTS